MQRLSIIIVNYRTSDTTIDCLASLAPELAARDDWKVIVVDNASGDDSAEQIGEAIQQNAWTSFVTLIEAENNKGFAAGNNAGIRNCNAANYLLLNSDTLVRPGAIARMLKALEDNPHVGLVGPRLEWPNGTAQASCFRFRSPTSELVTTAGFSIIDRLFPRGVVALPVSKEAVEVPWLSFACVLIRREVFDGVGLLDDGYFMYFEDIDFARRARRAGWTAWYEPDARVVHLRGGSSPVKETKKHRRRVPRYYYESRSRYFAKWYGGRIGLSAANVCWLVGRGVSFLMEVVRRREPFHCAHEARDNWTNWTNPYRLPVPVQGDRS